MVPGSQWPQMLPHCIRLRWQSSTCDTAVTDIRRAALWKFYGRLNCTASLLRITCTLLAEASGLQIAHFLWSFISDMFSRPRWKTPTLLCRLIGGKRFAMQGQEVCARLCRADGNSPRSYVCQWRRSLSANMTTWLQRGAELQAAREAEAAGGNMLWFLTFSYTVCCVLLIEKKIGKTLYDVVVTGYRSPLRPFFFPSWFLLP